MPQLKVNLQLRLELYQASMVCAPRSWPCSIRRTPRTSCRAVLKSIGEAIRTTVPVPTEAFHLLVTIDRDDFRAYRMRRGHRNVTDQNRS